MKEEKIMSTRNIISAILLTVALVVAALPAKAQADRVSKSIPDVTHDTWTSGAAMPTALNWPAVGVAKGKIYVVGGYTGGPATTDTQVYNPASDSWSTAAALPVATGQATAAVVKNILYVFGGSNNGGGTVFNNVWAYNPKTDTWTAKSAMPTARCSAIAVADKSGIIFVIGGYNSGARLNTVEAYDPLTDSWTDAATLINGKTEMAAGLFKTKTGFAIVAADGFTSGQDTGDNEAYNITTNTWSSLTSDPNGRNGVCSGAIGTKLYVSDGNGSGGGPISVMESYRLSTNTWASLTAMPNAVTDPGSAVYKKRLYCIGGGNSANPPNNTVYNYVQIYQP